MIPLDEVVHFDVITRGTSGVSDADSAPTFDVFEEATDTPILDDQTMTKRTSLTGNYRGTFTASAANGFEAGKWYNVVASATVGGTADKTVALTFRVAPAESSAGVPKTDVSHWLGTAAATPTVAGVPEVDVTHWIGTAAATPTVAGVPEVDVTHWIGTAAATPSVAGVPEVDVTHVAGSTTNVSTMPTNVADILVDTAEIGTAGAGLTNINLPNQTMDIVGNITGNLSGSVGSIGTGGIAAASFAAGAIDAAAIATNAIGSDELAASAITEIQSGLSTLDASGVRTAVGLASANLDTQLAAIAADLPARITKNTALSAFPFFMVLTSDHITGATGKTVTATRSLDGAAFAACANSVTEIANGWYKIDLATTDLNANTVALKFTATDCDARMITIVTQPT